jgi:LmbE family N-acetylglucosaminyl deacetylase
MPEEQLEAWRARVESTAMMMDGVPFRFVGYPMDGITTIIDIEAFAEQKLRGIQCHATQVGRESRFAATREEVLRDPAFQREHFLLAQSSVGRSEGVETDLFAGIK